MIRKHEYPIVGSWYWDIEHSEQFEIVAEDKPSDSIEIQYFSGEIEELEMETWFAMKVVSIAAPKDWSGPFEIEKDSFSDWDEEEGHAHIHVSDPLQKLEDEE